MKSLHRTRKQKRKSGSAWLNRRERNNYGQKQSKAAGILPAEHPNAVNQQINISKSKHRTMLNREAIGQVVSYCAVAAAHDLWDWGEKESTLLTLKMNNAASRYILDHDKYGAPEAKKRLEARTAHLMPEEFWLPVGGLVGSEKNAACSG